MESSGLIHVVLNYIGPGNGQGFQMYQDGEQTVAGSVKYTKHASPGDGRVVLGRRYTDRDELYASVNVDELQFFNKKLSDQQIKDIKDTV